MRYLSVCSGIEAATVAWHPLGWTPVAFSEIEPFPAAVLAHHYPNVPNYGDMTKHKEWPLEPGSIDLLVGGTPCQSFSVAGLRKGISDPRGGLMLTYLEIAQRLRPRWLVWENVPGVLSSGGGRDFGSFLGALGELGYGWAYRVLDAQWCRTHGHPRAVPQRRRRVFVVGCLGDWERAAAVLFERESVQRDSAPRRATREGVAADAEAGVGAGVPRCADTVTSKWSKGAEALQQGAQSGGNCIVTSHDVAPCLETTCHDYSRADGFTMVGQPSWPAEVAPTLNQSARGTGAPDYSDQEIFSQGAGNLVPQPVAFAIYGGNKRVDRPEGGFYVREEDTARTLDAAQGLNPTCSQGGTCITQPVPYDLFQITAPVNRQNRKPGDPCHTLARDNAAHAAVAFASNLGTRGGDVYDNGVSPTVRTGSGLGIPSPPAVAHALRGDGFDASEDGTGRGTPLVMQTMNVRRLTPRECERLQAFPDDYTLIPWRKKPAADCPDGPRYKALGNSMAVNCMAWIGERIAAVEARND